jgi:hypothetical protein
VSSCGFLDKIPASCGLLSALGGVVRRSNSLFWRQSQIRPREDPDAIWAVIPLLEDNLDMALEWLKNNHRLLKIA